MARSRQDSDWMHTSALMALLVNINRDPKKTRAAKPEDFHPMRCEREESAPIPAGIEALKALVCP